MLKCLNTKTKNKIRPCNSNKNGHTHFYNARYLSTNPQAFAKRHHRYHTHLDIVLTVCLSRVPLKFVQISTYISMYPGSWYNKTWYGILYWK